MKSEYLTSELIRAKLDIIKQNQTQVCAKEEAYNIIVLKTPNGDMTIKTKLTLDQWIKENNLRGKNISQPKKKRK